MRMAGLAATAAAMVTVKVTASVMASVTARRTREREAPVFRYNLCPDIDYDLAGVFKIYWYLIIVKMCKRTGPIFSSFQMKHKP